MTVTPRTIEANQPIVAARRIMKEYGVRHLPVVDDRGRLVGVVSERDIHVAQAASADRIAVEEIMTPKPYAVAPNLLLQQVVRNMAAKKLGSAVIMDHGRVLGVFTTTDALDVLADALEGKLVRPQAEVDVRRRPMRGRTRRIGREALV
jgi:acetoin utilization protein AcuB